MSYDQVESGTNEKVEEKNWNFQPFRKKKALEHVRLKWT